MDKVPPEWALKDDGSLGNTLVPKLDQAQEHLARLASERYEKILDIEREKLQLSGRIAALQAEVERLRGEPRCPACGGRDKISNGPTDYVCQHCSDLKDLEECEKERDSLREQLRKMQEALDLYDATEADEMKYSPEFEHCREVAALAKAGVKEGK